MTSVQLPGQRNDQAQMVAMLGVSPGYFDVLRIPMVAGRGFNDSDAGARSSLVNESMARRFWPNENPVGRSFIAGTDFHGGPLQVVGVVKDAHTVAPDRVEPMFYLPSAENPSSKLLLRGPGGGDTVSALVARLDPRVRFRTASLATNLDEALASSRVGAALAAALGAFALVLATIGVCGVFGYVVQQRTREIGIRMALGAQPGDVVRLILAGNSGAVLTGLAGGLLGAMVGARLLQRELYGLSPFDPAAYTAVALILAAAGLAASYWPARRATRLDPAVALRHE